MESCMDLNCELDLLSFQGDDSNAIMLPSKKKNKKKGMSQVPRKLKGEKKPELSKSQKRKLKKLEEEKVNELRLSKSIETLEKYKIREDAYSLMWSSSNLGQVETGREKRRREMHFSKVGLELPHSDRPFKRRTGKSNSCEIETDPQVQSQAGFNGSDPLPPFIEEKEVPHIASVSLKCSEELVCGNGTGSFNGIDGAMSADGVANESNDKSMLGLPQNSFLTCSSNGQKIAKPEDKVDEGPKVNISSTTKLDHCHQPRVITTPTIVHVSRPKELEDKRRDLPIVMMEQEIMEAINENLSVIICGETGCGKTTQVPQFLFEAGFASNQCTKSGIIGVTQPRRVAVLATAKRVAYELGLRLGKEVGFQVRHDKRIGGSCSIKFMTDGILLRELQTDFLLKRYSVLILDEAHERSLNTDILIGMLSRIIQERQKIHEEQQKYEVLSGKTISPEKKITPLKLVLMSATLRVEDFVSGKKIFRDPPPVIEVPTRQYPVTIHFSKRTEIVDYVGQAYKKVLSIHKRLPSGGILVFVTGQREVEYLCRLLRKASREMVNKSSKGNNEVPSVTEGKPVEESDTKEINEAFDIQENSNDQQTDRFSSYDGDDGDLSENESDLSYDSEEDSDLEVFGDDGDLLNQKTLEPEGNLADVLGDDGNLDALKNAFETLAGKNALKPADAEGEQVVAVSESGSKQLNHISGEKKGGQNGLFAGAMSVFPLYAMLPASAQLRVFEGVREGERLVVVATNVAETSLTIPGIKYVVDTGREKVKNYNSSSGMETYEVQWISKASAAQRAGRAGRTGPGHCYRLYSSAVFNNIFPDFSCAEISKIPVDGVVLLMKSMGIDKVANFPFPTPPNIAALIEAERCLKILEAINSEGRLTPLGKAMARYPMSPRHSRMLLTVIQIMKNRKGYKRPNLVLGYTVAAAAALSLSNPFIIQFEGTHTDTNSSKQEDGKSVLEDSERALDKEEKSRKKKRKECARVFHSKFSNPTSDALTIAYVLQCFEQSESQVEFCNNYSLHLKTMEEMTKLRKQLLNLVFNQSSCDSQPEFSWAHGTMEDVECAWRVSSDKHPLALNEEELLGQAICAGWADRVAKRVKGHSGLSDGERKVNSVRYQACMVSETVFLHRWSSVSKFAPEFLVYSELLHTRRPYINGATTVKPDWLVKYAGSLCTFSTPLADPKPYYEPQTDKIFCWITPTFGPHLWQLPLHSLTIKDDMQRVAVFASSLLSGHILPCLRSVRNFLAASPASILRPEASGHKRVGNLLSKLKTRLRTVDSCAMLREVWDENPREFYSEILDWFQEGFRDRFDDIWAEMHHEVLVDPKLRFPNKVKRDKS